MPRKKQSALYRFPSAQPVFRVRQYAKQLRAGDEDVWINQRSGGVQWNKSIYYYWWRFLRLSDKYRKICEREGDYGSKALKAVYADFGDVFTPGDETGGFRSWWRYQDEAMPTNRGALLFGYKAEERVTLVTDAADLNAENTLFLAVPKGMRLREIKSQLDTILNREVPRKRGERLKDPEVKYKPLHERMHGLESALRVYEQRRLSPKMSLWELAHHAGIKTSVTLEGAEAESGKRTHAADKKAYLAQHAHRLLSRADKVIAGVERGVFPATK